MSWIRFQTPDLLKVFFIILAVATQLSATLSLGDSPKTEGCAWNSMSGIQRTLVLAQAASRMTELSSQELAYEKRCLEARKNGRPLPAQISTRSDFEHLEICGVAILSQAYVLTDGINTLVAHRSELLRLARERVSGMDLGSFLSSGLRLPGTIVRSTLDSCIRGLSEGLDRFSCMTPERQTQQICGCALGGLQGALGLRAAPKLLKTLKALNLTTKLSEGSRALVSSLTELLQNVKPAEVTDQLKTWLAAKLKDDPKSVEELIAALAKSESQELKDIGALLGQLQEAKSLAGESTEGLHGALVEFAKDNLPAQIQVTNAAKTALANGGRVKTDIVSVASQNGNWYAATVSGSKEKFVELAKDGLMGIPTGTNSQTKGIFNQAVSDAVHGKVPPQQGRVMTYTNIDKNGVKTSNDAFSVPGQAGGHEFGDDMFRTTGAAIRNHPETGFPMRLTGDEILELSPRSIGSARSPEELRKVLAKKYEDINKEIYRAAKPKIDRQVKHLEGLIQKIQNATTFGDIEKLDLGIMRGNRSLNFAEYKKDLLRTAFERHFIIRHDMPSISAAVAILDDGLIKEAARLGKDPARHLKEVADLAMAGAKAEYKKVNGTDRGVVTFNIWKNKETLELNHEVFNRQWIPPSIPVIRFTRSN